MVRGLAGAQVGIQHGHGDNGKWVCGLRTLLRRSACVVYSFGSTGETSFEQDVLRATKCGPAPLSACSTPSCAACSTPRWLHACFPDSCLV